LFALTLFSYPLALALLCLGAGLLVDRCSGRFLPAALLPSVGAAALIALSQLSTWIAPIAPATPYLMAAFALAGFAFAFAAERRTGGGVSGGRLAQLRAAWPLALVPLLVYLLALAPVLAAGRASFSSFMALSDSAVHMIGADYLIEHGQRYAHLDLHNSYGLFISAYYGTGYPSGADTLFGGSALLLHAPLIWAFQPFNGFVLALGTGPAWLLARRFGLQYWRAALAALAATVPALVYGYQLVGSIKELTAAVVLLTLGALVAGQRHWLAREPRRALPCALVLAGGISALGIGFGAWGLASCVVLLGVLLLRARSASTEQRHELLRRSAGTAAAGTAAVLVAAWPTWLHLSNSLQIAENIASTGNPGNLQTPLKWTQAFGVWLQDSYRDVPVGAERLLTYALVAVALAACVLGALQLLRRRRYTLAAWLAGMLLVWLVLSAAATTWVDAKALVLTSPLVVLLAWGGLAALGEGVSRTERTGRARSSRRRLWPDRTRAARLHAVAALAAGALALALIGGTLASDFAQYRSSNLAPTARYEELAAIDKRFAGRGPTLFVDFDEYAMYVLRHLDVAGPDFVYPPPALAALAGGYGLPVELDRAPPRTLVSYPLIVTRRDPSTAPPPVAYALAWQGAYYDVWARRAGAAPALAHVAAGPGRALSCARVIRTVRLGGAHSARAVAALAPQLVRVSLRVTRLPTGWGRQRGGFAMRKPGAVSLAFRVPRAGSWQLWLQGQFMPPIRVGIDGRVLAMLEGQLAGNSLVPDTARPIAVQLSAGEHTLTVERAGFSLAPGNGGAAVLAAAFLAPAHAPARVLRTLPGRASRSALCARGDRWIELVRR
jgi:hypothetical protein